jgi:hypothetical protein
MRDLRFSKSFCHTRAITKAKSGGQQAENAEKQGIFLQTASGPDGAVEPDRPAGRRIGEGPPPIAPEVLVARGVQLTGGTRFVAPNTRYGVEGAPCHVIVTVPLAWLAIATAARVSAAFGSVTNTSSNVSV